MKLEDVKKALEGLNISDEQVKKVAELAESEKSALKQDIEALKSQLSDRDKDIEELKKTAGNNEELTKQLTQLQDKYEADTKALKAAIEKRDYTDAVKSAITAKGIKFTSKAAESYYLSQAEAKQLKIDGGKLIGFDDFHNAMVEADKDAFVIDEPVSPVQPMQPSPLLSFSGPAGQQAKSAPSAAILAAQKFNNAHGVNTPAQSAQAAANAQS